MKTLYVTDLDGTLLNSQQRVSDYSLKVINDLVEKGMLFTYATARSLSSASIVAKGLSTKIPIIAYNGAFILEPDNSIDGRKILSKEDFSCEERDIVVGAMNAYNISPLVYSFVEGKEKVSWLLGTENKAKQDYLDSRKGDIRLRCVETNEELFAGKIFYFTCMGEKAELEPLADIFLNDDKFTCTFQKEIYKEEYWLEIMPKKATKANAILKLKELWGCDKIVSFGDAMNDIPMFQISDECYAVQNAVEELKAIATGIIPSNNEDGVAKWLQENV